MLMTRARRALRTMYFKSNSLGRKVTTKHSIFRNKMVIAIPSLTLSYKSYQTTWQALNLNQQPTMVTTLSQIYLIRMISRRPPALQD